MLCCHHSVLCCIEESGKCYWLSTVRSSGFVLEGFPRTADEALYMAEMGLFPDAAIIMNVSDGDVIGRLLPPKMDRWRVRRDKRLEKKAKRKEKKRIKKERSFPVTFVVYLLALRLVKLHLP